MPHCMDSLELDSTSEDVVVRCLNPGLAVHRDKIVVTDEVGVVVTVYIFTRLPPKHAVCCRS
jgi:hypothetical protein